MDFLRLEISDTNFAIFFVILNEVEESGLNIIQILSLRREGQNSNLKNPKISDLK